MPLRLVAGISKKVGLPRYSSLGAHCDVEVELAHALIDEDPEGFHQQVRRVYAACRRAVEEELTRQQAAMAQERVQGNTGSSRASVDDVDQDPTADEDGQGSEAGPRPADEGQPAAAGHAARPNGRQGPNGAGPQRASARQIEYARTLALRIRGLGVRRLDSFCQDRLGKPLVELSGSEASRLIGVLQSIRAGHAELASLGKEADA